MKSLVAICTWLCLLAVTASATDASDPWLPDSTAVREPLPPARSASEKVLDVFSAGLNAPLYPLRGLLYAGIWAATESPLSRLLYAPAPMTTLYPVAAYGSNSGYKGGLGFYSKNLLKQGDILRLKAYYSTHEYERYGFSYDGPTFLGDRLGLRLNADYRLRPWESFYGLGNDARQEDEVSYSVEQTQVGGALGYRADPPLYVELFSTYTIYNLYDGNNPERLSDLDSIAMLLDLAPEVFDNSRHWTGGLSLDYDWRDHKGHPTDGGRARLTAAYCEGVRRSAALDFYWARLEFGQYLELFSRRVLALRMELRRVDRGDDAVSVPFYLRSGLGGSDLLRGYRNERFMDRDLMQVAAEYCYPVWGRLDGLVILEEGRVFSSIDEDFEFKRWRYAASIGMRVWNDEGELARVLTSFGKEGARFYIELGAEW